MAKKKEEESLVFNTKMVNDIIAKDNKGIKLNRTEQLWFNNQTGVRKAKIKFSMTNDEIMEYAKSKLSVHYFAENYCQIKREDGSIGKMKLRDYQKQIIDLYTKHSRSILIASRQTGKCLIINTLVKIKKENVEIQKTIGELYYETLSKTRPLLLTEKIKFKLYQFLSVLT
jgi:hypothetical protein